MFVILTKGSHARTRPGYNPGRVFVRVWSWMRSKHAVCVDKTRPEEVRTSPARLAKAPRRVGGNTGGFSKAWAFALALGLMHIGTAAAGTPPGTVISNTGSLSFTPPGGASPVTQQTNTVDVTVVSAGRTPSTVSFLDYAPGSPAASGMLAGPTACSTDRAGADSSARRNSRAASSRWTAGQRLAPSPT